MSRHEPNLDSALPEKSQTTSLNNSPELKSSQNPSNDNNQKVHSSFSEQ